jgi:formyl-CoA transferase
MADWMTVPLLQHEGGRTPQRVGLAHPSISPYGVFKTREGAEVLISIQNDREWVILARDVMGDAALAADPDFATNLERVRRRPETDGRVARSFGAMSIDALTERLITFDIAFGRVSDPEALRHHPHLRRITVGSPTGPVSYPAPAALCSGAPRQYGPVPALGAHTEKIRKEFGQ